MNSLSLLAEVFFRRLWNKADDFGRYDARPLILKAELFPLREIRLPDISRCLQECEVAGLLVSYKAENGTFLQISNFNQRVRAAKSKYPPMPDGCRSNVSQVSDNRPREKEDESEISPSPRVRTARHFSSTTTANGLMGTGRQSPTLQPPYAVGKPKKERSTADRKRKALSRTITRSKGRLSISRDAISATTRATRGARKP